MEARDLMTESVRTIRETDRVGEACELLTTLGIRHLPVVNDDGEVTGMLSDRDVRTLGVGLVGNGSAAEEWKARFDRPVSALMSANVTTIEPSADILEVVDLMLEEQIGALPVVDPETSDLVGIVSYVDVLRGVRDLLGEAER